MGNTVLPTTESSNLDDYMLQKKVELMMEINNKKVINELNKMIAMISNMNENVLQIRNIISDSRNGGGGF